MAVKAILFGEIGTLVECAEQERRAFNAAFADLGLDWVWDPFTFRALRHNPSELLKINEYAAARGAEVDGLAILDRQYFHFTRYLAEGVRLRPGVQETISAARAHRIKLGLVPSQNAGLVEAVLASTYGAVAVSDLSYVGQSADDEAGKPAPDVYKRGLRCLGLGADEVVAVEDNPVSADAAVACGIRTVGFQGAYASDRFDPRVVKVDHLSPEIVGLAQPTLRLAC